MIILEADYRLTIEERGRITTNDVVAIFGVQEPAEKYLQIALVRGFIRHGRCVFVTSGRDYDLKRYSCNKTASFSALPALEKSG
ncbi:DUF977 family protein [Salmonella enterica subsp. enterica]|nr:DUF977 family protein [Salmonella enterica subsp. enterica]